MLRIKYELEQSHFLFENGELTKKVREPTSTRAITFSKDGKHVSVNENHSSKLLILPKPVRIQPDPINVNEEIVLFSEQEVVREVSQHRISCLVSVLSEERTVQNNNSVKKQKIHFFVIRVRDKKSYIYADLRVRDLERICLLHSLPRSKKDCSSLPLILNGNVVGHVLHELVHMLEMDMIDPSTVSKLVGRQAFKTRTPLKIYEFGNVRTVGFNAFTDEGKMAKKMLVIDNNHIVNLIDSSMFPYKEQNCGYVGYGKSYFPVPRSTNLVVETDCEQYYLKKYIEVTELNLKLLSFNPLNTGIYIKNAEGLYVQKGVPLFRVGLKLEMNTTLQELLANMVFVEIDTAIPAIGGICIKNENPFRSAQVAPPALWLNAR